MRRVKRRMERKRVSISHMRFGKPRVRWFKREGCLSTEERISDDGMPGVGGAMCAVLLAVRRCIKGEGSNFGGGNMRTGGEPGDGGVEDMRRTVVGNSRRCLFRQLASLTPPTAMHPATRRNSRLPTSIAVFIGILLGALITLCIPSSYFTSYSTSWRGSGHAPIHNSRPTSSRQATPPTLEQRRRVLDILSTLSPHYTRECNRNLNPLYARQARDRYAPLIGHNPPASKSWLFDLGLGVLDPYPRPRQEEASFYSRRRDLSGGEHTYFFAINLYNSFDIIPDLFATLFRVSAFLGYHNVFVSIYENGSTDQTKALLRIFDALARSVGLRVTIRTSQRTRGAFNHRIEYLAEVRNAAFVPLHEQRNAENEYFDTIIFMNDILPCMDDLLELIYQSRLNNAGITCATDYMYHEELVCPPQPPFPCVPGRC